MNDTDSADAFESMAQTFDLLMSAKHGILTTPVTIEVPFPGEQAEAMGSARHVADEIRDEGYEVETEHLRELEPQFGKGTHEMRITVTEQA